MKTKRRITFFLTVFCVFGLLPVSGVQAAPDPAQVEMVENIRQDTLNLIESQRTDGSVLLLTFEALYEPLNKEQRDFLDRLRALKPSLTQLEPQDVQWVKLENQKMMVDGTEQIIPPQMLPQNVFDAYQTMNKAMFEEIGKRLLVESGYRSPAYQLYLFVFFMPNHDYSISETERHVALPGRSEHGRPERQAIDFINEQGINGEYNPPEFEALPEYVWLQANANRFGFYLSYPRGGHSAFEPWHWHYRPAD